MKRATLQCQNCGESFPRSGYSKTQWKKRGNRKCKTCTMLTANNMSSDNSVAESDFDFDEFLKSEPSFSTTEIMPHGKENLERHTNGQKSEVFAVYAALSEKRSLLLVFGYLRHEENQYGFAMPIDLMHLLIRFDGGQDAWDKDFGCSPFIELTDDERTIIHKSRDGRFGSVYLSNVVSEGIHCWVFKVTKMRLVDWSIIIGVYNITETEHLITQNYPFLALNSGYCYFVRDAKINDPKKPYCTKYRRAASRRNIVDDGNNVVTMTVDLDERKINWKWNDEEQHDDCAFSNVIDGMYRAVVTLTQYNNAIELLSYQQLS